MIKSRLMMSVLSILLTTAACNVAHGLVGGKNITNKTEASSSTVFLYIFEQGLAKTAVCTGTLIAKNMVLTAAHCSPRPNTHQQVVVGFGTDLNSMFVQDGKLKPYGKVTGVARHPDYDFEKPPGLVTGSDIAVLKFEGLELPEGFKVRELPDSQFIASETDHLLMLGFGKTDEVDSEDTALRSLEVPITQIAEAVLSHAEKKAYMFPGSIILNQSEGGVCDGDSGGPLYVKTDKGLTLLGTASMSMNLNDPEKSGRKMCHGDAVFADLRPHVPWIKAAMAQLK